MDFYNNELMVQVESRRRFADLRRDARRLPTPSSATDRSRDGWTRDFAAWVADRAKLGATFMARTPMNP